MDAMDSTIADLQKEAAKMSEAEFRALVITYIAEATRLKEDFRGGDAPELRAAPMPTPAMDRRSLRERAFLARQTKCAKKLGITVPEFVKKYGNVDYLPLEHLSKQARYYRRKKAAEAKKQAAKAKRERARAKREAARAAS